MREIARRSSQLYLCISPFEKKLTRPKVLKFKYLRNSTTPQLGQYNRWPSYVPNRSPLNRGRGRERLNLGERGIRPAIYWPICGGFVELRRDLKSFGGTLGRVNFFSKGDNMKYSWLLLLAIFLSGCQITLFNRPVPREEYLNQLIDVREGNPLPNFCARSDFWTKTKENAEQSLKNSPEG